MSEKISDNNTQTEVTSSKPGHDTIKDEMVRILSEYGQKLSQLDRLQPVVSAMYDKAGDLAQLEKCDEEFKNAKDELAYRAGLACMKLINPDYKVEE